MPANGLDKEARSKGGKARAEALSPEERSEISRKAARARWRSDLPHATHDGDLQIGDGIPCAVLEDGTRVLSERGVTKVLGGKRGGAHWRRKKADPGGANLPVYLSANNLRPFITEELEVALKPIEYRTKGGGGVGHGIKAEALPMVCEVLLRARDDGKLHPSQEHIAKQADILMRGLARIGIIALVDEATGFQSDRARDALAKILEEFVSKELSKWAKTFDDDFYRELFRLRGLSYDRFSTKRPRYIGKLTNDIVYQRLAPGVLDELKRVTPRGESGRPVHKFHQRLTPELGHPKLREHLAVVTTVMKLSPTWGKFIAQLNRLKPKHTDQLEIDGLRDIPYDAEIEED